ncbi:hypothetical protein LSAT2_012011 [Lamellibrachia satsuma]|nr:hypothetical protein LSAT2_012011 [Lamellibrachia satsuma]
MEIIMSWTFLSLNRSRFEETMRASVVLLFAFLALTFVATHAAVEEEADDPSLSVNEDSDEVSVNGVRVKREESSWADCRSVTWGSNQCYKHPLGYVCDSLGGYGGCEVYVWKNGLWNKCHAQGTKGGGDRRKLPGWSKEVEHLKQEAIFWHRQWRAVGNNFAKAALLFRFMRRRMISCAQFDRIQSLYAVPAVMEYWEKLRMATIQQLQDRALVLAGDGRNDSPGYCAQYCSYTFMDCDFHSIVSTVAVDKREVNLKSANTERLNL